MWGNSIVLSGTGRQVLKFTPYLKQEDWRVHENSNVNYSLGGLILHNSGAITANYWLENIYNRDIWTRTATAISTCTTSPCSPGTAQVALRQLITEGLGKVKGKITSRPPRHLSRLLVQQMVNFLGILQNEWAGAQAFSSFDTYLAPFVNVDRLSFDEVKQHIQSFVFGVNTPSRWGSQAPFTNITFDWMVPEDLREQPAIVGGQPADITYGECQREMDIVNRAFLEVMLEGDAEGRGFSYPIPTYNLTQNFRLGSGNARLLFKMTGKYGTPYFQNFINSSLDPGRRAAPCAAGCSSTNGCCATGAAGLFGADEFTGSIGVVTINLPRIGYLATSRDEYFTQLDHFMDIARDFARSQAPGDNALMDQALFPYTQRYLRHWNNHFSTIGLIGMNESALNFMGKDLTDASAREFAKRCWCTCATGSSNTRGDRPPVQSRTTPGKERRTVSPRQTAQNSLA